MIRHYSRMIAVLMLFAMLLVSLSSMTLADSPHTETLNTIANNPIPDRDAVDLAVRFRGLDPSTFDYATRPVYNIGDREQFIISSSDETLPRTVDMTLVAAAEGVYFWVEDGLNYKPIELQPLADAMSSQIMPHIRGTFGEEAKIPSDSNIYVFNVIDAGPGIAGVFNDSDRFPNEIFPTSNEVNSFLMAVSPSSPDFYISVLAHEFQHMVQVAADDSDDTWFIEGFAELGSLIAAPEAFSSDSRQGEYVEFYTGNQLTRWANEDESTQPFYAAASLFLSYVTQRYGEDWIRYAALEPTDGVIGIERALEAYGVTDPITGQPVTFNDLFADFVVTNLVNDTNVADGRFGYTITPVTSRATPTAQYDTYPINLTNQAVNQYGTQYLELTTPTPQTLTINFQGQDSVKVLPARASSGNYFYWSQRGNQADTQLTGRFDLTGISSATLKFMTWYEIEEFWDYGYISVSTDNGVTWQVIQLPNMTEENPYDRAFAAGFTGISGSGEERPAPFMGFTFDESSTVLEVLADSPAGLAGVQAGDIVTAINDEPVSYLTFIDTLDQYTPGQSITLMVNRGGENILLTIAELGSNQQRTISAKGTWVPESVDLTPFVGNEILLRFDYVTDQATSLPGWLLDDVSIPEINFFDDMEGENPAWTSAGWVRINNIIPQDYLVQLIEYADGINVTRLLQPGEGQSGSWQIELAPNKRAVLAISGIAPITLEPAPYTLNITTP